MFCIYLLVFFNNSSLLYFSCNILLLFCFKTLGEVPPYDTGLYELEKIKGLTAKIFPIKYGNMLLSLFFSAFLILPLIILINYLLHKKIIVLFFYKKVSILLVIEYCIAFFSVSSIDSLGGWYLGFILD